MMMVAKGRMNWQMFVKVPYINLQGDLYKGTVSGESVEIYLKEQCRVCRVSCLCRNVA